MKEYTGGTVNVSVALPFEVKQALEQLAHVTGISRNKLIVSAILTLLDTKKDYIQR